MEESKRKEIETLNKTLEEISEKDVLKKLVQDNKIEFTHAENTYRVRKPTLNEVNEINESKRKKYLEFINDDTYLFRKQWIERYAKKDIDIRAMEKRAKGYEYQVDNLLMRLAVSTDPKDIESLTKEIENLKTKQVEVMYEISELLKHSIEEQLSIYEFRYTAFLVLEKKEGEEWKRVYTDWEVYDKEESKLVQAAHYYIGYLVTVRSYESIAG